MTKLVHLFFIYLLFVQFPSFSSSDDLTTFVYAGCSPQKYAAGSAYQFNVESVLSSLVNSAGFSSYSNFTASSADPSNPAAGFFQCRGDVSLNNCQSCVRSALSQLRAVCPSAAGAAIQLPGCFLRYGNDSFIGRPDTTLVLKKCGADAGSAGYNSNLLGMLSAALGQLQAAPATSNYRSAASGFVQAMAQCDGDLSPKDCTDCITTALSQLQTVCGVAVSGDVYLDKCYARYWSNGVHTADSSGNGKILISGHRWWPTSTTTSFSSSSSTWFLVYSLFCFGVF